MMMMMMIGTIPLSAISDPNQETCEESHVVRCNQSFPNNGEPSLMEGTLLNSELSRSEKGIQIPPIEKYFHQNIELSWKCLFE